MDGDLFYLGGESVALWDAEAIHRNPKKWKEARLWEAVCDASFDLIKAGDCLYAAGAAGITRIELDDQPGEAPEVDRTMPVSGEVRRLIAADEKLFAVTSDGRLLAYGDGGGRPERIPFEVESASPSVRADREARAIIEATGVEEGYALVYGAGDGDLLAALAARTDLTGT